MSSSSETTPDQLLESFRGRSFKSIILFTLVAHLVVIIGSSIPYFIKSMSSETDSTLSEQARLDLAAREASSVLRDIASKHGLQAQDLSAHLSGNAKPTAPAEDTAAADPAATPPPASEPTKETPTATTTDTAPPAASDKPKTAIETEMEVKKPGPTVPPIPTEEAEEEDLFR